MIDSTMTTARRRTPRSTVGIRCVAVFFLVMAIFLAAVVLFLAAPISNTFTRSEFVTVFGPIVAFSMLFTAISIGLFRHRKFARWAAVVTSVYMAVGGSVVGIMLFMYLIRPEHDGRFV